MPKLSPEQQDTRRRRILDAAEQCFARNGFHRTTMQDICREAGISAGALYLYFASKEALIEGLTERDREEYLGHIAAGTGDEDFAVVLRHLFQVCIVEQPPHKAALFVEIGAEATRNPVIARTLETCDRTMRASIRAFLHDALDKGRIAPGLPLDQALLATMALIDGVLWRRATDPTFDVVAAAPAVMATLNAILRPTSSGEKPPPPSPRKPARASKASFVK